MKFTCNMFNFSFIPYPEVDIDSNTPSQSLLFFTELTMGPKSCLCKSPTKWTEYILYVVQGANIFITYTQLKILMVSDTNSSYNLVLGLLSYLYNLH